MIRHFGFLGLLVAGLGAATVASTPAAAADRVWFGGGLGANFGDVDYVSFEPMVGAAITSRLSVGGQLIYRYRKDHRFSPSLSTSDYGAGAFARYRIGSPFFLQAEYEHLSYEYLLGGTKERDDFDSVLGGIGLSTPMRGRASFFALALYNFSYDSGELRSPYSDAWIYRVGVSVGF